MMRLRAKGHLVEAVVAPLPCLALEVEVHARGTAPAAVCLHEYAATTFLSFQKKLLVLDGDGEASGQRLNRRLAHLVTNFRFSKPAASGNTSMVRRWHSPARRLATRRGRPAGPAARRGRRRTRRRPCWTAAIPCRRACCLSPLRQRPRPPPALGMPAPSSAPRPANAPRTGVTGSGSESSEAPYRASLQSQLLR